MTEPELPLDYNNPIQTGFSHHSIRAHARLAASAAARWSNCEASTAFIEQLRAEGAIPEDTSSPAAIEGEFAHEVSERYIRCLIADKPIIQAPNVSDDMHKHCLEYAYYCNAQGYTLSIEAKLPLFYSPGEFCTADYLSIRKNTLHVVDFKYGKGVHVSVSDNLQLVIYAICGLDLWDTHKGLAANRVMLHIYQPRLANVQSRFFDKEYLESERERLQTIVNRINTGKNLEFTPGDTQCRFCPAKPKCPAIAQKNYALVKADFEDLDATPVLPDAVALDDRQLAAILKQKDLFTNWLKSVEAYAYDRLSCGIEVPGFKLVEGRSVRKWNDEAAAMKLLKKKILIDERSPRKVLSPPQILKKLGAMAISTRFTNKLNSLITKPKGRPVIAQENDKRPSINPVTEFPLLTEPESENLKKEKEK